MTNETLFATISPKLQREFNPSETIQWLTYNPSIFMSWGVSKRINLNDKALLMKVSGNHHKGWVAITLAWDDTYSIYYINNNGTFKEEQHNVYCDMLRDVIDDKIEKITDYQY
ncbi:MAG: hypothetical protein ACO3E1_12660 [Flavobacteriales bacterium]